MNKSKFFTFISFMFLSIGSGLSPAHASLLELSHEPLFLNQSVPPAIAVTLDDSGSMAWGYLGSSSGNAFADPNQNRLYYNPNIKYTPPIKADGSQMPNIDYKNAPVNGYLGTKHGAWFYQNLETAYRPLRTISYYSNGTFGGSYAGDIPAASNDGKWTNAFYLERTKTGYKEIKLTSNADLTNFANWFSYYNTRMKLARASISRAFAGFGPNFKLDWQMLHSDTTLNNLNRFENTHRNNFYQWLFEAPTSGGTPLRAAFNRAGKLFEDENSYKYKSEYFDGAVSCQQNFHIAISDGEWNGSNVDGLINDNSTHNPLPGDTGSLDITAGFYGKYDGTGQQNVFHYSGHSKNLADIAFHYWANDLMPSLSNNVQRYKSDYTDKTGAQIDFSSVNDEWEHPDFVWNPKNNPAYWQHVVTYNVGMGLESLLVERYKSGIYTCPQVTALSPNDAVIQGLRNGDCNWTSNKIDDVYHSSLNSRGEFFSANDPDELIKALNDVVRNITERLSRGSTSTISSGVITNDTMAFSPGFDSSNWSGNLIAREVNSDGTFGDPKWDASCVLTGGLCAATGTHVNQQVSRDIYTYDKLLGLVKFDSSLPSVLKSLISDQASEVITRTGATVNDIIDYVNGDQSKEITNGGVLRNRSSLLADIVHGSPAIVRGPGERYDDSLWPAGTKEQLAAKNGNGYLDFQKTHENRHNVLYTGSNSGMLHAFDADNPATTEEYWGYVPNKALSHLYKLIDPQFDHWSYVDNTPVVRDAFFNDKWHTTLVGGMRYGGQAFFALDITQAPSAAPKVLWEFSDEDDPDMGYTYGQASVVRISSTGDWVALLPNGYNNSQYYYGDPSNPTDTNVSGSGNAVLFVVRLSDGKLLAKLDTGVGSATTPNGLATAVAVDSRYSQKTNSTEIGIDIGADFAYAGDLYGNLWRFDFTSANYSDWSSSIKRIIKADNRMYRPITVQPRVINLPANIQSKDKDVIVMFGTGKYIEVPDRAITLPTKQYMVGIVDGLTSTNENISIDDNDLHRQIISADANVDVRYLSDDPVDLTTKLGWKVQLPDQGERSANPMTLVGNLALFVPTIVTAGIDPCEPGGRSWITAFNPYTGGTIEYGEPFTKIKDKFGNPLSQVVKGDSVLVNDIIIGGTPFLEKPGSQQLIIEGSEGVEIITFKSFTWRRRNWTNLLTE